MAGHSTLTITHVRLCLSMPTRPSSSAHHGSRAGRAGSISLKKRSGVTPLAKLSIWRSMMYPSLASPFGGGARIDRRSEAGFEQVADRERHPTTQAVRRVADVERRDVPELKVRIGSDGNELLKWNPLTLGVKSGTRTLVMATSAQPRAGHGRW